MDQDKSSSVSFCEFDLVYNKVPSATNQNRCRQTEPLPTSRTAGFKGRRLQLVERGGIKLANYDGAKEGEGVGGCLAEHITQPLWPLNWQPRSSVTS